MDETIVEFLQRILPGLIWIGYARRDGVTLSAIDTDNALEVVIRLRHPERYQEGFKPIGGEFNPALHYHYYSLDVKDPRFRWGRKMILHIEGDKEDPYYELIRDTFNSAREKASFVSQERIFEARIVAVQKALQELTVSSS